MKDDDQPITRGNVRKGILGVTGGVIVLFVVGGILMFFLYILACANMPTGCH